MISAFASMTTDTLRELAAFILLMAYLFYCWQKYFHSPQQRAKPLPFARNQNGISVEAPRICVVYASQSGQAESLARNTGEMLSAAGCPASVRRLEEDWAKDISAVQCVLFIVSTYGEGGAPEHAAGFVRTFLEDGNQIPALRGLRYGVLALGDSSYPAFCAFGRRVDAWLKACGAIPLFERMEADRVDPAVLQCWYRHLADLTGADAATVPVPEEKYAEWILSGRECLNSGSPGSPICLIRLRPAETALQVGWQAGDLVDLKIPGGDGRPRAYSISNLPGDGCIELIVRRQVRDDGQIGQTSGWLTEAGVIGASLALRIRENPGFHLQQNMHTPLILIGSGAGIAGLRAHIKARASLLARTGEKAPARDAWLFFGERSGRHDHLCRLEIDSWKTSGVLSRVNIAFSRDDPVTPYVQDSLLAQSREVCEWIASGAQILICGNARKMAVGVDEALRQILGTKQVDLLCETGRIRRDIF